MSKYEDGLTEEAIDFLAGRGLKPETARTFRLGVVDDPEPGHEPYRNMIAIPYLLDGQPVSIRFRNLHGEPKYLSLSGSRSRMFNVGAICRAWNTIHLAEGEFDAMILHQLGLDAVAMPGVESWQPYHGTMLAGFSRVWVWGDPDYAGANFITTVINRLPRSAKGVKLREGDVTDTYLSGGPEAIFDLLEEG